jgi:hypothetical protein
VRIPEELCVVGFDDLPLSAMADPPLTTVRRPLAETAVAATEMALALGRGEQPAQIGVELATTLTVRGSTARRPTGRIDQTPPRPSPATGRVASRSASRPAMARTPWPIARSSAAKSRVCGAPFIPVPASATPR